MAEPKRLFCAIQLGKKHRALLSAYKKKCQKLDVRWTPLPKLHITVLFIGGTPQELVNELNSNLEKAVSSLSSFYLPFSQFCIMPEIGQPRMIWAEFKSNKAYAQLVECIKQTVMKVYPVWQPDNFDTLRPHVTLARFEKKVERPTLHMPSQTTSPLEVLSTDLVESTLSHHGSSYKTLKTYALSTKEGNEKT